MAQVDLLFGQPPITGQPVDLIFGADDASTHATVIATLQGTLAQPELHGTLIGGPVVDASIAATLPQPALSALLDVRQIYTAALATLLPQPALLADLQAAYLSNTARPTVAQATNPWQPADFAQAGTQGRMQSTVATTSGTSTLWQRAVQSAASSAPRITSAVRTPAAIGSAYSNGVPYATQAVALYQDAIRDVRNLLRTAFANAARAQTPLLSQRHQDALRDRRAWLRTGWQVARPQPPIGSTSYQGPAQWLIVGFGGRHQNAMRPPAGMYVRPPPPAPQPCYLPRLPAHLLFADLADSSLPAHLVFACEQHPGTVPGEPIIVPILRAYVMLHDISVTRVSDGISIPVQSMQIALDVDSPSWTFSAKLLGPYAVDAVRPDVNGNPVVLQASIDGTVWRMVVEEWGEDRSFGSRSVSCKGRGLSSLLSQPYQLSTSGTSSSDMTMQQLLNAHLPIGSGWAIQWLAGTPDWIVPAGAWSWADKSPLAAMQDAASGTGLVLLPDTLTQTITVQPRYPVLPWEFDAATPGLSVPDAAIVSLQRRNTPPSQANAAMVAGGSVGGVLARVYRSGSAGDRSISQVQHPLITHTYAARLLGSRLLAGQHQQPEVASITLPLGGEIPLGMPGTLLQATIDGAPTRGIVNGVQVAAQNNRGTITVRQTLTLGEETPNLWSGFARLVPKDALRLATVQATYTDGTATVQYPGGGTQRVRNPIGISAGSSAYVRGDKIDGEAPSLTPEDITV